jgi:hypothetical protein
MSAGLVGALGDARETWSIVFDWFQPIKAELKLGGAAVFVSIVIFLLSASYLFFRQIKNDRDSSFDLPFALSAFGVLFSWISKTPLLSLVGLFLAVFSGCIFLSRWGTRSSADRELLIPFAMSGFVASLCAATGSSWGSEAGTLLSNFFAVLVMSRVYPFHSWVFKDPKSPAAERALILGFFPTLALLGALSAHQAPIEIRESLSPVLWFGLVVVLIHQLSALSRSNALKVIEAGQASAFLFCGLIAIWLGQFAALIFAVTVGLGTWGMLQWLSTTHAKPERLELAYLVILALAMCGFPLFSSHQVFVHLIHELLPHPIIFLPLVLFAALAHLHVPASLGRTRSLNGAKKSKKALSALGHILPLFPLISLVSLGVLFGGWKEIEVGRWLRPLEIFFNDPSLALASHEQTAALGGYFIVFSLVVGVGWFFSGDERSERLHKKIIKFPGGSRLVQAVLSPFQSFANQLRAVLSEEALEHWFERPLIVSFLRSGRGIEAATRSTNQAFVRIGKRAHQQMNAIARELQNGDIQRYLFLSIFASVFMALILLVAR